MNRKAFTLIELLVVIIILGILASLITGNFFTSLKKGRDAKRKSDLEQIQRSLEMYYEDKRTYPLTAELTFGDTMTDPVSGKVYMQKVPNDPVSGKNYQYLSADGTDYKLFACLENNLQRLTYLSTGYTIPCDKCRNANDTADVDCIWGISSSNISP
jgi:type II secretion system protein G